MLKLWNFRSVQVALLSLMAVLVSILSLRAAEDKLTKEELKTLVTDAKTTHDHQCLAAHFSAKADELDAEAKEHTALAATYKAHPPVHEMKHQMSGQTAGHCDYFAASLHKAALEARKLAADHAKMAKEVK